MGWGVTCKGVPERINRPRDSILCTSWHKLVPGFRMRWPSSKTTHSHVMADLKKCSHPLALSISYLSRPHRLRYQTVHSEAIRSPPGNAYVVMSTSNRSRSTPVIMAALCASDPWKQCTTSDGHLEIIEIKRPKTLRPTAERRCARACACAGGAYQRASSACHALKTDNGHTTRCEPIT